MRKRNIIYSVLLVVTLCLSVVSLQKLINVLRSPKEVNWDNHFGIFSDCASLEPTISMEAFPEENRVSVDVNLWSRQGLERIVQNGGRLENSCSRVELHVPYQISKVIVKDVNLNTISDTSATSVFEYPQVNARVIELKKTDGALAPNTVAFEWTGGLTDRGFKKYGIRVDTNTEGSVLFDQVRRNPPGASVEEIFTNLDSSVSKVEKYKLRLDLHQNYKLTEAVPPAVQSTNSVGWMFSFLWNLDTSPSEKDESREVLMYFEDADRDAASQIQTIMWGGLLFLCLGAVVAEFVSWVRGGKEA